MENKLGELEINKVYCMDCLEGLKKIPDRSVDLIVTDPPYFIENLKKDLRAQTIRRSSQNSIFHAEWDSSFQDLETYKEFIIKILDEFKRVLKEKGQVYMFFSYHHYHWARILIEEKNFRFYKPLIWYKPDIMGVFPNQYGCNYELIMWFRNNEEGGEVKLNIGCRQRDVFMCNSTNIKYRKECGFHPTPKPKELIKSYVKNGSDEGDVVLDAFMGSGTTAVACKETKRKFIGFELNPEYIKIAERRLSQEQLNFDWFENPPSNDQELKGGESE